jgi:DNA-binding NarL/FixJ family response regulator
MDQGSAGSKQMLLIESDQKYETLIVQTLEEMASPGCLDVIRDCPSALVRLRQSGGSHPQLVLLDLDMPGKSAFDFLEAVKEDPKLRIIPVVILACSDDAEDVAACYSLGVAGYLVKSDVNSNFAEKIKSACGYWTLSRVPTM